MAKIIRFPGTSPYGPLRVRNGNRHNIRTRVVDLQRPEETRWQLQFAVQRAASFRALNGLTDASARAGSWHAFKVAKTFRIRRLLRDVQPLVDAGRIVVEIDGTRVQMKVPRPKIRPARGRSFPARPRSA